MSETLQEGDWVSWRSRRPKKNGSYYRRGVIVGIHPLGKLVFVLPTEGDGPKQFLPFNRLHKLAEQPEKAEKEMEATVEEKIAPPPAAYPEHEKLHKVAPLSQVCGEFLDWLQNEKGLFLAVHDRKMDDDHLYRADPSVPRLLAEFFGIDERKLEAEKRALLEEARQAHR